MSKKIECLIDGSFHYEITTEYLRSLGWTKAKYLRTFPDATLKHKDSIKHKLTDKDREERRKRLTEKLKDPVFQANRKKAIQDYWNSVRSKTERIKKSERTKWQHTNTDLKEKVKEYFESEDFKNSQDRQNRINRFVENNPKKKLNAETRSE